MDLHCGGILPAAEKLIKASAPNQSSVTEAKNSAVTKRKIGERNTKALIRESALANGYWENRSHSHPDRRILPEREVRGDTLTDKRRTRSPLLRTPARRLKGSEPGSGAELTADEEDLTICYL